MLRLRLRRATFTTSMSASSPTFSIPWRCFAWGRTTTRLLFGSWTSWLQARSRSPSYLAMSAWAVATMGLMAEPVVERFFQREGDASYFQPSQSNVRQWRFVVGAWRRAHPGERRCPDSFIPRSQRSQSGRCGASSDYFCFIMSETLLPPLQRKAPTPREYFNEEAHIHIFVRAHLDQQL